MVRRILPFPLLLTLWILSPAGASAQIVYPIGDHTSAILMDNELQGNPANPSASFHCNPMLDGKPLNFSNVSVHSQGKLQVAKGNPRGGTKYIPFRVGLLRNGKLVETPNLDDLIEVEEVDLQKVLAEAEAGDQLLIEPVGNCDRKGRRLIELVL